ncbi:hypothetical protein C8Q78DRAFT_385407 [Trametes maxima]|nr:hypothetical protein C8Q78DRAFT_385407 [Trametes maxima]
MSSIFRTPPDVFNAPLLYGSRLCRLQTGRGRVRLTCPRRGTMARFPLLQGGHASSPRIREMLYLIWRSSAEYCDGECRVYRRPRRPPFMAPRMGASSGRPRYTGGAVCGCDGRSRRVLLLSVNLRLGTRSGPSQGRRGEYKHRTPALSPAAVQCGQDVRPIDLAKGRSVGEGDATVICVPRPDGASWDVRLPAQRTIAFVRPVPRCARVGFWRAKTPSGGPVEKCSDHLLSPDVLCRVLVPGIQSHRVSTHEGGPWTWHRRERKRTSYGRYVGSRHPSCQDQTSRRDEGRGAGACRPGRPSARADRAMEPSHNASEQQRVPCRHDRQHPSPPRCLLHSLYVHALLKPPSRDHWARGLPALASVTVLRSPPSLVPSEPRHVESLPPLHGQLSCVVLRAAPHAAAYDDGVQTRAAAAAPEAALHALPGATRHRQHR